MAIQKGTGPTSMATPRDRRPSTPDPQSDLDNLLATLFGGGDTGDLAAAISDSYDGQIAAYEGMLDTLGETQAGLVGNIHGAADATSQQIGGFYDYAAQQAQAGRPVVAQTGTEAQANVDSIYDELAATLAGQPQAAVDRASQAAGGDVGGSVAGRVAAATAPFEAAGETSRANTKANLTQHSAAGQDYLSQLAAAAPSEAAMQQGAVASAANQAVTESEMAMAQQRAEIAAQTAALEGAKQRALIEHSADMAGSTFDRLMQTTQLFNALGADTSPIMSELGLQPDFGAGNYEDQLDVQLKEARLLDMLAPENPLEVGGDRGFDLALSEAGPTTQRAAETLRERAESEALSLPEVNELLSNEEVLYDLLGIPAGGGEGKAAASKDPLDPSVLRDAFRAWYQ